MAWGQNKADIDKNDSRDVSSEIPATFLQNHHQCHFRFLDQSAASELTRFKTPWLVSDVFGHPIKSKAIVWLCQKLNNPF
jgi:glucosamine-6-phosphate deaminase